MSEIYNDLMKTINSLPENPFAGLIVLLPATRITREVEVTQTNENGEEITTTKTESFLNVLPSFQHIETEMRKSGVEYQLSEHAPQKDKDGKPCVFVMEKPSFDGFSYTPFGFKR